MSSPGDLIVTFLALLEMIRLKLMRVFQAGTFGPIRVYKRDRDGCSVSMDDSDNTFDELPDAPGQEPAPVAESGEALAPAAVSRDEPAPTAQGDEEPAPATVSDEASVPPAGSDEEPAAATASAEEPTPPQGQVSAELKRSSRR